MAIDGVPGTAAPISLNFLDAVGSKTGKLLPTGRVTDMSHPLPPACRLLCRGGPYGYFEV